MSQRVCATALHVVSFNQYSVQALSILIDSIQTLAAISFRMVNHSSACVNYIILWHSRCVLTLRAQRKMAVKSHKTIMG